MDCNIYLLGGIVGGSVGCGGRPRVGCGGRRCVGCGGGGSVGCGGSFVVDGSGGCGGVVIAVIFIWFSPKKLRINDD